VLFGKDISSSYEEALENFKRAAAANPADWPKNDWMMAQCLAKQKKKDTEGAIKLMQKVLASDAEGYGEEIQAFAKKNKIEV
jgi:hypothetical protein